VVGEATKFHGIFGVSHDVNSAGVYAHNDAGGSGVVGISEQGTGVVGITNNPNAAAVSGQNTGGGMAGNFQGNVNCTGDLTCGGDITLTGGDCAEQFQLSRDSAAEPGVVMVMNETGEVTPSSKAYDRRVVGVVSGAGDLNPGIILDRKEGANRATIALLGKVYCKVDASVAPIRVGDLLTTSDRPGHAMKAQEEKRAFGAVIGKALRSLDQGCDLIPVLVTLQ
jgi:hypothetical protein